MNSVCLRGLVGISAFLASTLAGVCATRPIVLELFTSQGCSSCPPADALLTSLSARRDLLPLAFHVTYWNSLGWRDPYSLEAATSRQALYAARLGGGSYTPELVVDGRRGVVGSDGASVATAIDGARSDGTNEALPVHLSASGGSVSVSIGRGEGFGRVMLVGFDARHETHVGRGENEGQMLIESNVVRSMRTVGQYAGEALHVTTPRPSGSDAAVIVQAADGRILGAARL